MAMLVEMLFLSYIGKLGLPSFLTTFLSACAVTLFIMTMSRLIHIENVTAHADKKVVKKEGNPNFPI